MVHTEAIKLLNLKSVNVTCKCIPLKCKGTTIEVLVGDYSRVITIAVNLAS